MLDSIHKIMWYLSYSDIPFSKIPSRSVDVRNRKISLWLNNIPSYLYTMFSFFMQSRGDLYVKTGTGTAF